MRENLSWRKRYVSGTEEHREYEEACRRAFDCPREERADLPAIQADINEAEALLATDEYRAINEEFEQVKKRNRKRGRHMEPKWHAVGSDAVPSIGAMAKRLGRSNEYLTMYRYFSYLTHGSYFPTGVDVHGQHFSLRPVRDLEHFSIAFNATFADLATWQLEVAERYRADETERLKQRIGVWAPTLARWANVSVERQWVSI